LSYKKAFTFVVNGYGVILQALKPELRPTIFHLQKTTNGGIILMDVFFKVSNFPILLWRPDRINLIFLLLAFSSADRYFSFSKADSVFKPFSYVLKRYS